MAGSEETHLEMELQMLNSSYITRKTETYPVTKCYQSSNLIMLPLGHLNSNIRGLKQLVCLYNGNSEVSSGKWNTRKTRMRV